MRRKGPGHCAANGGLGANGCLRLNNRKHVDLGPDAERVAPPDQLQQHAVRVRDKRVLVGRAAGEELLWCQREAQRLAEPVPPTAR